ncbi:pentapeptide repeat-containing protein [Micromonospora pisi]|uniref:pentapeptide repeat-containing protein n=1 Tax=Micromonospora pisi TaxID=589240 RepID=UPI0014772738|nr:pentapeptide repeat-containing protein [Micromonospora pisi]
MTLLAVVVVLCGGAAAMWLLGVWSPIPAAVPDPQRLRLDRIKTGLTVTAGLAAALTLLMTLRRQAWSEHAQQFTQADAIEQRITALYVAAAEQLGSSKAAVRLAGLYALERLGQDNPKLRRTVMEVFCAYLRMPFVPPVEVLLENTEGSPQHVVPDADMPEPEEQQQQRREELQVRLTAQRLIAHHLHIPDKPGDPEPATYWRGAAGEQMSLDLTGATLVSFNLSSCHAAQFHAGSAQFHGNAELIGAHFHGGVRLRRAQFHHNADLSSAQFHGHTDLSAAQFYRHAILRETQFHGEANLRAAEFHGDAQLGGVQFHGYAYLFAAQFHSADLIKAQFHGDANLGGSQFHGRADLSGAQFHGSTELSVAQFHRHARLSSVQFHGHVRLSHAEFHGDADLRAKFAGRVEIAALWVTPTALLPPGWALAGDADYANVKDELRRVVRSGGEASGESVGRDEAAADVYSSGEDAT